MKRLMLTLSVILLCGCSDFHPTGPITPTGLISVNVHWGDQGVPGIPVVLLQTGDSLQTGSNGMAIFPVRSGHYVVRVYGINRGGPVLISSDYSVDAKEGEVAMVDIVDCLPCL
ncbi:MAG TPA: hypothetical protein VMF59_02205 [Bacteroidota bacterium]|nr:hypothetical protein [Bacteroidota bacterium]